MRRSLLSLTALVCGLCILFVPTLSTSAAPRAATLTTTKSTVNRASLNRMNAANAAASMARAKRYAKAKHGAVYIIQARNPNWTRSNLMTADQAAVTTLALRHQGMGAHVHNLGSAGSFVHYGMVHWLSKGAVTNRTLANAVSAKLRTLGLQARVVTRVYKS